MAKKQQVKRLRDPLPDGLCLADFRSCAILRNETRPWTRSPPLGPAHGAKTAHRASWRVSRASCPPVARHMPYWAKLTHSKSGPI